MDMSQFEKTDEEIKEIDTKLCIIVKTPDATGHTNLAIPREDTYLEKFLDYVGSEIQKGRWAHVWPQDGESYVLRSKAEFVTNRNRLINTQKVFIGNLSIGG